MPTAFIFPGQGSQFVGMGVELYEQYSQSREVFLSANEILGYDIKKICFEGPSQELLQTKNSQPAILIASIAQLKTVEREPSAVAGLSLGEYTALIAAGCISFKDGLRLVRLRAEYMQEASSIIDGGMASVIGLEEESVGKLLKENCDTIDIANLNCPGQVVISGINEDIKKITPVLQSNGAKRVIFLDVSGPFHSRYMESARVKLAAEIENITINKPVPAFYANVTGAKVDEPAMIKKYLIEQVTSSVYWEKTIKNMRKDGISDFTEIGPGNVLTGLLKRIE